MSAEKYTVEWIGPEGNNRLVGPVHRKKEYAVPGEMSHDLAEVLTKQGLLKRMVSQTNKTREVKK